MNIVVVGAGYVGLANAALLADRNDVVLVDVSEEKVDLINNGISPLDDPEIKKALSDNTLSLRATTNAEKEYKNADYVIVSVPTNFVDFIDTFDTSIVTSVVEEVLNSNDTCSIVIKSTIPIGYCSNLLTVYPELEDRLIFSPEFLREGSALRDCYYPSRVVVGCSNREVAKDFSSVYTKSIKCLSPVIITGTSEAEAIKLFSNSYLAMRVAYFNELDTYAECHNLNSKDIIDGVCLDPRILNMYNNPSFGYGGYCFPKDTKQLKSCYSDVPNSLISSIVESNSIRKNFIVDSIIKKSPDTVGIYKLAMKSGSDNCREAAIIYVMRELIYRGVKVVVYEPNFYDLPEKCFVVNDLEEFKKISDLIIANRYDDELKDVTNKLYTRDLYRRD